MALPQANGLPSQEALSYDIEWRLITAGKAQMDWSSQDGRPGWQLHLHLESVGFVSKLFKVEDDYTSRMNESLCAQSADMKTHEGTRRRQTSILFDGDRRKAVYEERDLAKNISLGPKEIDIPACVHDVIGGIYFLRTLRLDPGQSTEVPVSDGKKSVMAKVEAQQREDLKTPAGVFKTIRYEIYLFNNVLYRRSAHLHVWLTDDAARLPVQIRVRMPFTIGTITLALDKQGLPRASTSLSSAGESR
ncbi:MAG TPA: DUF3108 domain-containing protein [Bryobacteraceae bacterium]|nr:DUF3108 domain-containing protein [Bryobacteraceae bacterium]